MQQITDFDDLDEDAQYCYNKDTSDDTTYTIEIWQGLEDGEPAEFVTLSYRDGYVSDLSKEKFTEHIDDGKVYQLE